MSDREGNSGPPPTDDDLSLPKATVAKMISGTSRQCMPQLHYLLGGYTHKELLPSDIVCAKETRDLVIECCVGEHLLSLVSLKTSKLTHSPEFIHLISSEANEICEQESKKTIAPEHIIAALKVRPPHGSCNSQSLRYLYAAARL
jgi:histone H3/H4